MYTSEMEIKIWNDEDGTYIRIGPDGDGLDILTISYHDDRAKERMPIIYISEDQIELFQKALTTISNHMYGKNESI